MSPNDVELSKHKEEVSSLYRKNPLNRVMKHMIAKHGFHRKESEYKKKLKMGKEDYKVLMHEKSYTTKQAERDLARHITYTTNFALEGENDIAPKGVEVRTPRLMPRSLEPTREVRTDNIPWILFK